MPDTTPRVVPARYPWHEPEEGTCPVCYPYGGCGSPQPKVVMNDRWQSVAQFKEGLGLTGEQSVQFDRLNRQFQGWPLAMIYPGEVLLVGDPDGGCRHELEEQLKIARKIHLALAENEAPKDDLLIRNEALIKSVLDHASMYSGMTGDMWSRHLNSVGDTMKMIEAIHHEHLGPNSDGNKDLFYKKRDAHFKRLESQLKGIGRIATGLQRDLSTKDKLELSTKSFEKKGYIKGYSDKLDVVAKSSSFMKKGAYLGMGIATASTLLTIRNACEVGREGQCKKVSVVETSKLVGGQMAGAYLGTYMGGAFGATVCVGIGIPTGGVGTIVCLVALGAGGAWLGDKVGSAVAGRFSKSMYEVIVE